MKRRQFMQTLAVISTLTGTDVRSATDSLQSDLATITTPRLTTFLGDHDCICRIGIAYREQFPQENNPDVLARVILPEQLSEQDLSFAIETAITHDFDYGDTVLLQGWLLSRTEARQAALYSLMHT